MKAEIKISKDDLVKMIEEKVARDGIRILKISEDMEHDYEQSYFMGMIVDIELLDSTSKENPVVSEESDKDFFERELG